MSALSVTQPFPIFNDVNGKPLEDGFIYVGQTNQNPETNPTSVYWDSALTIPAAQPIRTLGGFPSRNGTPARLYVSADNFSITLRDKNQKVVYSELAAAGSISGALVSSFDSSKVNFSHSVFYPQGSAGLALQFAVNIMNAPFNAKGDGVTDDVLAIQAAINSGAKKIIAPAGKIFRITNTLLIDSNSVELDFQYSELLLDDAGGTKDHVMLGNGVTQRGGIKIHNVIFTRQQVATAGYAINSDFIGVCEIKGCLIYGNNEIHGGIKIYRGIIINIQNNYIDNCVNYGVYLQGANSGAGRTIDVTIRENRIEGGVTALNTWDFVEGVFCRDNIFFNTSTSCVAVNASTNANGLVSFKFQENDFDTSAGVGFYIDNVSNVQVTGCWFSNITGICLDVASNTDSIIIDANQMYGLSHGIRVAGQTSRISGNLISGGASCVLVRATARNTAIASNTLCNAAYAVNLAETCTDVQVTDNYCFNMSSGIFTGEAPGTRISITNNKGDPAFGAADYIVVGASPFTYTAGPRPEQVSVFSGTKTNIAIGGTLLMGSSDASIVLAPNQSIIVTYTSLPLMSRHFI